MNLGDSALERGDVEGALAEYGKAEALAPENLEMQFWHAVALINIGNAEEALPLLEGIFQEDAQWALLIPRLKQSGLLSADDTLIDRIESLR